MKGRSNFMRMKKLLSLLCAAAVTLSAVGGLPAAEPNVYAEEETEENWEDVYYSNLLQMGDITFPTPQNVTIDGDWIRCDAIDGVGIEDYYYCFAWVRQEQKDSVNGREHGWGNDPSWGSLEDMKDNAPFGTYVYRACVVDKDSVRHSEWSESVYFDVPPRAGEMDFSFDEQTKTLSWNRVDEIEAVSYGVHISGTDIFESARNNSYNVNSLKCGEYTAEIATYVDGDDGWVLWEWSKPYTFTIEPENTTEPETWNANFKFDETTGTLSWDICEEADAYYIEKKDSYFYLLGKEETVNVVDSSDLWSFRYFNENTGKMELTPEVPLVLSLASKSCFNSDPMIGEMKLKAAAYNSTEDSINYVSSDSFTYHYDGCDINTALSVPQNIRTMGGKPYYAMWDKVDGAIGYLVEIDNFSERGGTYLLSYGFDKSGFLGTSFYDLLTGEIKEGFYQFKICAVDKNGDRSEWSDSYNLWIESNAETWLANFKYDEETGILTWDRNASIESAHAAKEEDFFYVLHENYCGVPWAAEYCMIYSDGGYHPDETVGILLPLSLAYHDLFGDLTTMKGTLNFDISGNFTFYGPSSVNDPFSSDTFSYFYDGCDLNAALAIPKNLWNAGETSLKWEESENAVGYVVRYMGDDGIVRHTSSKTCEAVWLADFQEGVTLPDGDYAFEICAIDNKGDRSEWSKPVTLIIKDKKITNTPIEAPKNIRISSEGNLIWDPAEGASGYHVYIKGEGVDLAETTSENVLKDINTFLKAYPNGDYTIVVGAYNESGIERKCKDPFIFTKHGEGLFDKENESDSPVETPPEAAEIPETDKITSITINPAFNMKNKNDTNVELDLTKIKIKAKEIYDEAGLKRAEEALGEEIIGNKHYNLLDLTLLYDGQDFSNGYEGLVQVIIPLPKGHRNKTFSCYRLTEVNGKMTKEIIPGEQTEDSYIIYLEHFSEYALVADGGETPDDPSHTHSFSTEWKSDSNSHWHECSCGEKSEISAHTAGEWIVNSAAGYRHRDCTVCGAVLETASLSGGAPSGSRPVTNPSAPTETTDTENTDKENDPDDPKDEEPEEPEPDEADEEGDVDADTDENAGDDDEEDCEDNEPEDDGYDDTFSKDDTDGNDAEESSPTVTPEAVACDENPGTGVPANAAMIFGFLISGAAFTAFSKRRGR